MFNEFKGYFWAFINEIGKVSYLVFGIYSCIYSHERWVEGEYFWSWFYAIAAIFFLWAHFKRIEGR
jgi:hypothetical protein